MALDSVFDTLCARLAHLREALTALRTTAVEDRPLRDDAALVDTFGDAADDLLGWLEGAFEAALEARAALSRPPDLDAAGRALAACQERCNQIATRLQSDLLSYERIGELLRLGRARGGEWHAWSRSLKEALDWCRPPLFEANESLFACWREIVERAAAPAVTVQTMSSARAGPAAGAG